MKALIVSLLLTPLLFAQDADPFGGGGAAKKKAQDPFAGGGGGRPTTQTYEQLIDSIDVHDTTLEDLFALIAKRIDNPPNVIFKGSSSSITTSLSLKNVTFGDFLNVLDELNGVRFTMINSEPEDASLGILVVIPPTEAVVDPFMPAPVAKLLQPATNPNDLGLGPKHPDHPNNQPALSRAYPLGKTTEEVAVSAIRLMWESSDLRWSKEHAYEAFRYHKASNLLIIHAPEVRHREADDILNKIAQGQAPHASELDKLKLQLESKQHLWEQKLHELEREKARTLERLELQIDKLSNELAESTLEKNRLNAELREFATRKKSN